MNPHNENKLRFYALIESGIYDKHADWQNAAGQRFVIYHQFGNRVLWITGDLFDWDGDAYIVAVDGRGVTVGRNGRVLTLAAEDNQGITQLLIKNNLNPHVLKQGIHSRKNGARS